MRIKTNLGAVYTPKGLAEWVSSELLKRAPRGRPLLVLDPACGDGELLRSVKKLSREQVKIAGVDIDPRAIKAARRRLGPEAILKCADALIPSGFEEIEDSWRSMLSDALPNALISNPPWGAELSHPTGLLKKKYTLANGQFDSFDLFVELCLRIVSAGAVIAFIIPDALFFPEHKPLRELLLSETRLHLIARLGEGFFEDVCRGTAIVVCEKRKAPKSHTVECFRLTKIARKKILSNEATLKSVKEMETHLVPQERFWLDPEKRFDIDVLEADLKFFNRIHDRRSDWAQLLESGRGVELSKTGMVVECPECLTARPQPRQPAEVQCDVCGKRFKANHAQAKSIIKTSVKKVAGWEFLIVGEDVKRYDCRSSRIIKAHVPGINYKHSSFFSGRKLLVRKTGVGINAAIDESGALTNQVVFHYRQKGKTPDFFLDYVLGVMCSRVMLAYHLKRTGESEWRSHPYVTQKTLAELPIPKIVEGTWEWSQAQAIADSVKSRVGDQSRNSRQDIQIDSLVAGLYGLNQKGCDWVVNVLNEAQPLEAISRMKLNTGQLKPTIT